MSRAPAQCRGPGRPDLARSPGLSAVARTQRGRPDSARSGVHQGQLSAQPHGLAVRAGQVPPRPLRAARGPAQGSHPPGLALRLRHLLQSALSFHGDFMSVIHPAHHRSRSAQRRPGASSCCRAARPDCDSVLAGPGRSGCDLGLPRTPSRPFARHDLAAQEELAAPDSPGLAALNRTSQAGDPCRAAPAECLGVLHVLR